jgi:hypothetical protein
MKAFHEYGPHGFNDSANTGSPGGVDVLCQNLDLFCEQHVHLGSDAALQRKRQTQRRLEWVLALWDDRARFEALVKSGRYLRLCTLTETISDSDSRAWRRLKKEILAVRAREFLCGTEAA